MMRTLSNYPIRNRGVLLVFCLLVAVVSARWTWNCDVDGCERTLSAGDYSSLELCRLACGSTGSLWPLPSVYRVFNKNLLYLDVANIKFNIKTNNDESKAFLNDVVAYFSDYVKASSTNCTKPTTTLQINLESLSPSLELNWDTNEAYEVNATLDGGVNVASINIIGQTVFGVRHGLESVMQLIVKDGDCSASISSYYIDDEPFYKHRGLLLDTARNYLSVDVIKRNIIGMAMSKLNVLHWHMSDSQSFPFVSSRAPNMSRYGAYDDDKVYTPGQVLDLIKFAKIRGVRIIPEIDGPAHVGNGWQWGPDAGLGNLVVCQNQQPWRSYCIQPPCGQLNPANEQIYKVLKDIYSDIVDLWGDIDVFHMGGDEVYIPCWNSSSEILKYIGNNSRTEETFLNLWAEFQSKALNVFDSAKGGSSASAIVWTSSLTQPGIVEKSLLNDRYVIQTWVPNSDKLPEQLLALGYRIIISTKDSWYLDHGFWGSTSYYTWRKVYDNRILSDDGVLGGEVCMWGELVDDNNVESRVWPRAAAAAERLWSNPSTTSVNAEKRFFVHNRRLANRGIRTSVVTPEYCVQNENDCSGYLTYYYSG